MTTASDADRYSLDRRDIALWVVLLLLTAVALWPVLRPDASFAPGLPGQDGRTQWYPWRVYAYDSLKHGVLPLWNPYVLCGVPFVGDFQSALFYPPNLLFAWQPVGVAARVSVLFHIWLAMVFAYLLIRFYKVERIGCAVGGILFGLCAAQLLRVPAGHWGVSTSIPWLALTLLCVEWTMRWPGRVPLVIGAVAVAMQILAGVPQYVFISAVAAGTLALLRGFGEGLSWRARSVRWGAVAGMFLLGACVGAIQLLPGLEAAMNGARRLPMRREWIEQFSLGPENLGTLFVPGLFGGAHQSVYWGRFLYWEMNAYVGIIGLTLAAVAVLFARPRRLVIWFGALAAAMLLLALGKHTPLMGLLSAIPMSDMFRGSAKFLLPFSLAMAVLAGIGVQRVIEERRWGRVVPVAAGAAAVVLVLLLLGYAHLPGWQRALMATGEAFRAPAETEMPLVLLSLVRSALLSLVLLTALVIAILFFARSRIILPVALVGLVALDGVLFSWSFIGPHTVFKAQGSAWPAGAAQLLRLSGGSRRVLTMQIPEMNDGMLERVPTIEGIEPNPPVRFHTLFRRAQGQPVDVAPSLYQWTSNNPMILSLGLGYVLGPDSMIPQDSRSRVPWRQGGWALLELPSTLPRARVVYSSVVAATPDEALKWMTTVNPAEKVVLEEKSVPPATPAAGAATAARIIEDTPNRVGIAADLQQPGWLVLLDNDYPGWTVRVDEKPARLLRADYCFRAVALSAGPHRVSFTYRPPLLQAGFAVSLVALLGCALIVITGLKRGQIRPIGHI